MTGPFPRSLLFVPGDRERFIESAFRSAAEAIVLDLEDAVAAHRKGAARETVRSILASQRAGPPIFVRVNAADSLEGALDLKALSGVRLAGLVVPKVESAEVVRGLASQAGAPLVLLLETPLGVLRALDLGEAAGPALAALAFGAEDFRAAMQVDMADPLLGFALPAVAVAAAALSAPAIDAPELDLANEERLRARAATARALGFRAKFAIHPAQLAIIHEVFAPTAEQCAWAERVARAYDEGTTQGRGSIRVDDRLVDAATIKRARQILERSGS